jgi:hypothetical protein
MRRLWTAALIAAAASCRAVAPLDVGVTFTNSWRVAGDALTASEQTRIRDLALATLRAAFEGFDVRFTDGAARERSIRVEDTPYSRMLNFGAAGMTYPVSLVSSVRFDILANNVLASVGCQHLDDCRAKMREELVDGLGRGVGATAAHELGHQAGLGFSHDAPCDDCYDGRSSTSYAHFFGAKHWSGAELATLRRVLERRVN